MQCPTGTRVGTVWTYCPRERSILETKIWESVDESLKTYRSDWFLEKAQNISMDMLWRILTFKITSGNGTNYLLQTICYAHLYSEVSNSYIFSYHEILSSWRKGTKFHISSCQLHIVLKYMECKINVCWQKIWFCKSLFMNKAFDFQIHLSI